MYRLELEIWSTNISRRQQELRKLVKGCRSLTCFFGVNFQAKESEQVNLH